MMMATDRSVTVGNRNVSVSEHTSNPWLTVRRSSNSGVVEGLQGVVATSVENLIVRFSTHSPYDEVLRRLEALDAVTGGWDGHDAAQVSHVALQQARSFLGTFEEPLTRGKLPPPIVGPLFDGGIGVVWRDTTQELEVLFLADGTAEYSVIDRTGRRTTQTQENIDPQRAASEVMSHLLG